MLTGGHNCTKELGLAGMDGKASKRWSGKASKRWNGKASGGKGMRALVGCNGKAAGRENGKASTREGNGGAGWLAGMVSFFTNISV